MVQSTGPRIAKPLVAMGREGLSRGSTQSTGGARHNRSLDADNEATGALYWDSSVPEPAHRGFSSLASEHGSNLCRALPGLSEAITRPDQRRVFSYTDYITFWIQKQRAMA